MKRFKILFFIIISGLCTIGVSFYLNKDTVVYQEYPLPVIQDEIYLLDHLMETELGYKATILNPTQQELVLLVDRTSPFILYLNDEVIYEYTGITQFQRINIITLPKTDGELIELEFHITNPEKDLLGRWKPVVLFSTENNIDQASYQSFGVTLFYCGILLTIALYAFTLFFYKKSERYLPLLGFVASVEFIKVFLSSIHPLVSIPDSIVVIILSTVYLLSTLLVIIIGFSLLQHYLPKQVKDYLTPKKIVIFLLLSILSQFFISYTVISILLFVLTIVSFIGLISIYQKGRRDVLLLGIGYSVLQATILYQSLVFDYKLVKIGSSTVLFTLLQIGFICYIIICTIVVNSRFAQKFTEAEKLVTELENINLQLDDLVEQRTLQLETEIEQRHNIMSNLFHDLRSPVFLLQGYLEQLQPADKEQERAKKVMTLRLFFLKRLIDDLFTTVKLEDDALTFEYDDVDLNSLLSEIIQNEEFFAKEKQIQIISNFTEEITIWADYTRLQQAIENIIYNAISYSKENSTVTISTHLKNDIVQIQIQDYGAGIPEEDLPYLFTRYFRSNFSKNKNSSGLGLSIANELISKHRGTITVESTVDVGTIFTISLPILDKK